MAGKSPSSPAAELSLLNRVALAGLFPLFGEEPWLTSDPGNSQRDAEISHAVDGRLCPSQEPSPPLAPTPGLDIFASSAGKLSNPIPPMAGSTRLDRGCSIVLLQKQ